MNPTHSPEAFETALLSLAAELGLLDMTEQLQPKGQKEPVSKPPRNQFPRGPSDSITLYLT